MCLGHYYVLSEEFINYHFNVIYARKGLGRQKDYLKSVHISSSRRGYWLWKPYMYLFSKHSTRQILLEKKTDTALLNLHACKHGY